MRFKSFQNKIPKLQILRFEGIEETIYFIKRIVEKIEASDTNILPATTPTAQSEESNNLDYLSTVKLKKKDNLTPNNCNLLQLAQIPGMSLQNAQIIIDKYQSIANLIKSYYDIDETERHKMLMDIEISISNGKKRKLGKVLSERIYQYLFNISPTSI